MSAIDFTDNTTVVPAAWLDDVDASVYEQTGVGKTTVASATTPDIFAVTTGRLIDYTGTATCTGFVAAVSASSHRTLYCAGAAVFTADANLLIDGVASGSNLTCVANDILDVVAITTTQFKITQRTRTFLAATGKVTSSSPTAGIGYATGAGGTVTQTGSQSTAVTLDKICGSVVVAALSLPANSSVSFSLNNTTITENSLVVVNMAKFTGDLYRVDACARTGYATITLTNPSAGALGYGPTINFAVFNTVIS